MARRSTGRGKRKGGGRGDQGKCGKKRLYNGDGPHRKSRKK